MIKRILAVVILCFLLIGRFFTVSAYDFPKPTGYVNDYANIIEGNTEEGSLLAGQITTRIKDLKPAKTIIEETVTEAEKVISSLKMITTEN